MAIRCILGVLQAVLRNLPAQNVSGDAARGRERACSHSLGILNINGSVHKTQQWY
jgi:hypothetical protein